MHSKPAIFILLLLTAPAGAQSQAYDDKTPIEVLAADPAAADVLNRDLPGLLSDAQYPLFKSMSLNVEIKSGHSFIRNALEMLPTQDDIDKLGGGKSEDAWNARFELAYEQCKGQNPCE